MSPNDGRIEHMMDMVEKYKVDGVVEVVLQACHTFNIEAVRVQRACEQAGVPVADFSSHEYDTYFLREYSHPSDLGGAYYSKAIYTYLTTGVADTSPSGGVAFETRKE